MDLDRKAVRMFSESDQHAAITTSITTSFAISIRLVRVCSYRDGGRELFSIVFGAIGMKMTIVSWTSMRNAARSVKQEAPQGGWAGSTPSNAPHVPRRTRTACYVMSGMEGIKTMSEEERTVEVHA